MPDASKLSAAIRDVPDFPKPGILFKDITPVLGNPELFSLSIDLFCELAGDTKIDKVVGIDARGFIFAAAVAERLKAGFVPIRKQGKLPWTTRGMAYTLEYGEDTVEIHDDAVQPGDNVLLVDDLLATGGTAAAALKLLSAFNINLVSAAFLIELKDLNGRALLNTPRIDALITY